jgi:hypothetical protein
MAVNAQTAHTSPISQAAPQTTKSMQATAVIPATLTKPIQKTERAFRLNPSAASSNPRVLRMGETLFGVSDRVYGGLDGPKMNARS